MEELFLTYLNLSLRACWLILAVMILRFIFEKAPKRYRVILWALAGLRMMVPFTFESRFSFLPKGDVVPVDIAMSHSPAIDTGITSINNALNPVIVNTFTPSPADSANPLQIWIYIASLVWLAGIVIMVCYLIISSLLLKKRLSSAVCLEGSIYESTETDQAFVFGFFAPKIYLPAGKPEEDKRYMILHEQTHIAHGDHLIRTAGFLVLAIHWFNPLAWLSFRLLTKDIELACDESVLKQLNEKEHGNYAEVLLKNAAEAGMLFCPAAFGESDIKARIKNILSWRKPPVWISALLIICTAATAAGCLSDPAAENTTENNLPPEETAEPAPAAAPEPEILTMQETQEAGFVNYTTEDEELISRFETALNNLLKVANDGEMEMEYGYDNIMDYHFSMPGGSFGFQEGNFPYESVMYENVAYVEVRTLKDGEIESERFVLIPLGSPRIKDIKDLVTDMKNAASGTSAFQSRDPERVKSELSSLGDPKEYPIMVIGNADAQKMEYWNEFAEKVNAGTPASITWAAYTVEGDVIYLYLDYDGNDFFFANDSSRDKFGDPDNTFFTARKKYLSSGKRTVEEEGKTFEQYIAVIADRTFSSYDEIIEAIESGEDVTHLWGCTERTS